jgi:hypothetical protein
MKKAVKKLRLTRESLRRITPGETGHVAAASDMQNSCGSVCYTDKGCRGVDLFLFG